MQKAKAHSVVIVVFPGVNILDVAGPAQVFTTASEVLAETMLDKFRPYSVGVVSVHGGLVETTSGIKIAAAAIKPGIRIDTLLISGGHGSETAGADWPLVNWLKKVRPKVSRFGSICTGAFVLAGAGLLEGKRAATHWAYCDRLQANYPNVQVERDAIFIQDGGIWTSAGITSGMDLALAMVEEDWGRELALLVSRRLVVFLKRSGGQSQFSIPLQAQTMDGPLVGLVKWVAENPSADHRVERLASRANMSERTLHRLFRESFGHSPAGWVEQVRIEAARKRLEDTDDRLEKIAAKSGFRTVETMRRAFLRNLRVGPTAYRERFQHHRNSSAAPLQFAVHAAHKEVPRKDH